jgi:hypothetical protein
MTAIARTDTPPPSAIAAHTATQRPVFGANPSGGPR